MATVARLLHFVLAHGPGCESLDADFREGDSHFVQPRCSDCPINDPNRRCRLPRRSRHAGSHAAPAKAGEVDLTDSTWGSP